MLTLKSALYSREQHLTGQPRTRARHGGQPLESTSTARRTATGEHEHKSSGEHRSPTHDREKPTSPKPSINSPSGAFIWLPLVVWFFTPLQYIYLFVFYFIWVIVYFIVNNDSTLYSFFFFQEWHPFNVFFFSLGKERKTLFPPKTIKMNSNSESSWKMCVQPIYISRLRKKDRKKKVEQVNQSLNELNK